MEYYLYIDKQNGVDDFFHSILSLLPMLKPYYNIIFVTFLQLLLQPLY